MKKIFSLQYEKLMNQYFKPTSQIKAVIIYLI